jgi:threonine synthase
MDVGNPSNFIRIQEMYHNDLEQFKRTFLLILSDEETTEAMKVIYGNGYIANTWRRGLFRAKKSY